MDSNNIIQIPFTVDINVFQAYTNKNVNKLKFSKLLNAFDLEWEINEPKTLRLLALDEIIKIWEYDPVRFTVNEQEDKNYIIQNLNINLPLKLLTAHIKEDEFWKRCFINKWNDFYPEIDDDQRWISVYMEKYLSEYLEQLDPGDYDLEKIQEILEICSPYVTKLNINLLQASVERRPDHIPFDYILSNLPELGTFCITFDTKTIGTEYFNGCCIPSKNDGYYLCRGLEKCYELTEFNLHGAKADPMMMGNIARSLDKGCTNLVTLELPHCRFGDSGLIYFLRSLHKDSLPHLQNLNLTNNLLSPEAALLLSRALKFRRLKALDLAMNPIGSDGAAAVFSIIGTLSLEHLDVSACSITESIMRVLFKLIYEMKVLDYLDLSNNELGDELGKNLAKVIGFNQSLKYLDLRNTGIANEYKNKIYSIIFEHRDRL